MSYILTKSVANDFGNVAPNVGQFTDQVNLAGIFSSTPTFYGTSLYLDAVSLYFSSAPTAGDETALNSLISTYEPNFTPDPTQTEFISIGKTITATTNDRLTTFTIEDPTKVMTFKASSYTGTNQTPYTLSIYSEADKVVLLSATFSNTEISDLNTIGTLGNNGATLTLPTFPATLEVWGRRANTGSDVYINGIDVDY